jgi:hypothetical protein
MTIDRIFVAFMGAVGVAIGIILVVAPDSRDFRVSPYFWVLIAMAIFEVAAFARSRGAPGTVVTMPARLAGFVLAVVVMVVIPVATGAPGRLFERAGALPKLGGCWPVGHAELRLNPVPCSQAKLLRGND